MGSKKGEGGHYRPDNPSVTAFAVKLPLHKGGFARCGGVRADEGIGQRHFS